jgi:hypothetical protein
METVMPRELIEPREGDKRYMRRGEKGKFTSRQTKVSRSLSADCPVEKDYLILKQAAVSRPSGQWSDDDFDVLANGEVVASLATREAAGLNV